MLETPTTNHSTVDVPGSARVNGVDVPHAMFTVNREQLRFNSQTRHADMDWVYEDAAGHRHAWTSGSDTESRRLPTLDKRTVEEPREVDPEEEVDDDWDGGPLYVSRPEFFCPLCQEIIKPGYTEKPEQRVLDNHVEVLVTFEWDFVNGPLPGSGAEEHVNLWWMFDAPQYDEVSSVFGFARLVNSYDVNQADGRTWANVTYRFNARPGSRGPIRMRL